MTVVSVDDADAHHARALRAGADILKEPVDQPYGVREYGARDLEGQLWYFQSAPRRVKAIPARAPRTTRRRRPGRALAGQRARREPWCLLRRP